MDCILHIAISGTKYFHKVVWQHMQCTVGSVINTIANFLENLPVVFFNRSRFERVIAISFMSPFLFDSVVLFANFLS